MKLSKYRWITTTLHYCSVHPLPLPDLRSTQNVSHIGHHVVHIPLNTLTLCRRTNSGSKSQCGREETTITWGMCLQVKGKPSKPSATRNMDKNARSTGKHPEDLDSFLVLACALVIGLSSPWCLAWQLSYPISSSLPLNVEAAERRQNQVAGVSEKKDCFLNHPGAIICRWCEQHWTVEQAFWLISCWCCFWLCWAK